MTRFCSPRRATHASETALVKACLALLRAHGIFAWRSNTGATKIGQRFIRFGTVGASDIIGCLPDGRFLAVECKRPGNRLTSAQQTFQDRIRMKNGEALVIYNVNELEQAIQRILAQISKTVLCGQDCDNVSHA